MRVIVLKPHEYDGVMRTVGEVYESEEKFVPLMTAMGNVKPEEESPKSKRHYKRRDLVAEETES
jgi:hypothetical protein